VDLPKPHTPATVGEWAEEQLPALIKAEREARIKREKEEAEQEARRLAKRKQSKVRCAACMCMRMCMCMCRRWRGACWAVGAAGLAYQGAGCASRRQTRSDHTPATQSRTRTHLPPPQPAPTQTQQDKAKAVLRRQMKHLMFTEPEVIQAGERVTVYYCPDDTALKGSE
jgi:hypothetical protein